MWPRATTRRYGGPTIATSAPRSGWRAAAGTTPETAPVLSRHSTRYPRIQRISTAAAATAIEILLDGQTPEKLDEQTLLDAGKRTAELNLESATKRATIRAARPRRGVGLATGRAQLNKRSAAAWLGLR